MYHSLGSLTFILNEPETQLTDPDQRHYKAQGQSSAICARNLIWEYSSRLE